MPIIEVTDLQKQYAIKIRKEGIKGAVQALFSRQKRIISAVNGISFHIDQGEVVGYIGPNGSGKSTTIKMMSGILVPTAGSVRILGLNPQTQRKQVVQNLGVVFGQRTQLYWDLRLGESFELLKRIYRIDDTLYRENLELMKDILNIGDIIDMPVRQMSLGQRMRGDLTAAILHSPKILFLDEPTIGLDVDGKYAIRKFIKDINRLHHTTVILTTHDLDDIQELCSRVIVLNDGRIIEDGALSHIIEKVTPYRRLQVDFFEAHTDVDVDIPGAKVLQQEHYRVTYEFDRNKLTAAELIQAVSLRHPIRDLALEEPNIEDIIRHVYHLSELT